MKSLYLVLVVLLLSAFLLSQTELPPASQARNQHSTDLTETVWLSGNVAIEGGSAAPDPVSVVLRCAGQERARVSTSSKGEFSLMFSPDNSTFGRKLGAHSGFPDGSGCELYVDSPDYTSKSLQLFGELSGDINNVGTIVLYPRTAALGDTVSVTSLAAPTEAKKAFEKGQEQAHKGKLRAACEFFRRAVQVYPQYAIAWLELGRAQIQQNDFNSAQQSFYQATSNDSRLVAGYEGLAQVALRQDKWKDLADSTGKILEISPDAGAKIWFLNSAANLNLGDAKRAEAGVVRGLHLDTTHRVPQLEFLYGLILARRAAYPEAIQHLQTYLKLTPKDENAPRAQKTLAEVQKLASGGRTTAAIEP